MPRVTGISGEGVQAVVLALNILERLAEEGRPMGVTALADALGTTKSRIWRYLQTLVQQGYIGQIADTERYRLGSRLADLGRAAGKNLDLVSASYDPIRALRDSLGHAVVIAQVEQDGARVLATVAGHAMIEMGFKQGTVLGFHCSAQGKVALAFGSDALRAAVYGKRLERRTPTTIVSHTSLRTQIERVRRDGWATAPNEVVTGLNALAAPIFDATGNLVATVAIVDFIQFIAESPTAEQIGQTMEAAKLVSAALGYHLD